MESMYLNPRYDSRKSFYNKAMVFEHKGNYLLKSYDTFVCAIINGKVIKLWDGYSMTTMRHINDFVAQFSNNANGGKAWWDSLKVAPNYNKVLSKVLVF